MKIFRYRIMKKTDGFRSGDYYLQKKILWWWSDVEVFDGCIHGGYERLYFDTIEEAENWINPKNESEIVKEIN